MRPTFPFEVPHPADFDLERLASNLRKGVDQIVGLGTVDFADKSQSEMNLPLALPPGVFDPLHHIDQFVDCFRWRLDGNEQAMCHGEVGGGLTGLLRLVNLFVAWKFA